MSSRVVQDDALPAIAAGGAALPSFEGDSVSLLIGLAAWVRPDDPADAPTAIARMRALAAVLRQDEKACQAVRAAVHGSFEIYSGIALFADTGVLSPRGFMG